MIVRSGLAPAASTSLGASSSTASTDPSRSFERRWPASRSPTKIIDGVNAGVPQYVSERLSVMSPEPSQGSRRKGPVPLTWVRIGCCCADGSMWLCSHAVSSIARAGDAILDRNAASASQSSKTTVVASRANTRRREPVYGPYAGSALAGSSQGAGPSAGYFMGSKAPVLGGAVGKAVLPLGPDRRDASGLVDGDGPAHPTITLIVTKPAANRPGRGRRDIGA